MEGVLTEASGSGKSKGAGGVVESIVEKQLIRELGLQLGEGLRSGATDVTPEQREHLEHVIDALITVALKRAGQGVREDLGPELREMLRKDVVLTLSEGLRGELGSSLEETIDRVANRTANSLKTALDDDDLRETTADFLRDTMFRAVQEDGYRPGVGQTIERTLQENLLSPFERSVGGIADVVTDRVNDSAKRTENTLRSIIAALIILTGVLAILYFVRGRQLARQQEQTVMAQRGLRSLDAAIGALDGSVRDEVLGKAESFKALLGADGQQPLPAVKPPEAASRSDNYERPKKPEGK